MVPSSVLICVPKSWIFYMVAYIFLRAVVVCTCKCKQYERQEDSTWPYLTTDKTTYSDGDDICLCYYSTSIGKFEFIQVEGNRRFCRIDSFNISVYWNEIPQEVSKIKQLDDYVPIYKLRLHSATSYAGGMWECREVNDKSNVTRAYVNVTKKAIESTVRRGYSMTTFVTATMTENAMATENSKNCPTTVNSFPNILNYVAIAVSVLSILIFLTNKICRKVNVDHRRKNSENLANMHYDSCSTTNDSVHYYEVMGAQRQQPASQLICSNCVFCFKNNRPTDDIEGVGDTSTNSSLPGLPSRNPNRMSERESYLIPLTLPPSTGADPIMRLEEGTVIKLPLNQTTRCIMVEEQASSTGDDDKLTRKFRPVKRSLSLPKTLRQIEV